MSVAFKSSDDLPNPSLLRIYTKAKGSHWVTTDNLVYLEAIANYTWLRWADSAPTLSPHTLKVFVNQLPLADFVRIHRRYLVNRQFILQIEVGLDGAVANLKSGLSLPVSRRKLVSLRRQLVGIPLIKKE